jgi:hypothetical protein
MQISRDLEVGEVLFPCNLEVKAVCHHFAGHGYEESKYSRQ